jgi:hypothetical protein
MFAITKLFPSINGSLGTINRNVRHFLSLYGKFFPVLKEKEVDGKKWIRYMELTPLLERLSKGGELIKMVR